MDSEKKQHEALKQWLHRYRELLTDANRLWERAGELRGRIESIRTSSLDGMPRAQNTDNDRTRAALAQLEELEDEARLAQEAATAARREISATIKQIHGPRWADRREVLRLRYLDTLCWEDTAERLFGDDPKFWDKQDAFLRRAFKLHRAALDELAKYVPLEQVQENDTEQE